LHIILQYKTEEVFPLNKEIVCTESGLQISRLFALSLLHKWCPELRWSPEESIAAAEDAYRQSFDVLPDFEAMTKQSFTPPVKTHSVQEAVPGGTI